MKASDDILEWLTGLKIATNIKLSTSPVETIVDPKRLKRICDQRRRSPGCVDDRKLCTKPAKDTFFQSLIVEHDTMLDSEHRSDVVEGWGVREHQRVETDISLTGMVNP